MVEFFGLLAALSSSFSVEAVSFEAADLSINLVSQFLISTVFPILYRKQIDAPNVQSEQLFSAFMDHLPGYAWIKDVDGSYVYVNRRVKQVPSFQPDCLGKTDTDLWPSELAAVYRANDLKVIATGEQVETVEWFVLNGEQRYVLVTRFPIFDEHGAIIMVGGTGVDITEHKRAEEALREKERFASQIAELSPVVINVFDFATRRDVYMSPDVVNLLGYTPKEIAEMEDPFSLLWHPDDITCASEHLTRLRSAADGAIIEFEYRIRHRDGEWRWMSTRGMPFARDDHGAVREIVAATFDITDRKRAEDALRNQKEILQKIFDHIPAMISFFDADGRIKLVNREWECWRGWSLEEILSQNVDLLTEGYPDPEYRQLVLELAANSNGRPFDLKTKVRDGRVLDTTWSVVNLSDGTRIGLGQDITERKQAEEALRESATRFRRLLDSSIIGVVFWSLQGEIIDANDLFLAMVGYTRQDLSLGRLSWKRLTPPEYADIDEQAIREMAVTGACPPFEKEYVRKDGSRVSVLIGSALFDSDKGTGSSFVMDITERKRVERAQRESQLQYETLVHSIDGIVWEADPQTFTFTFVSKQAERILGYPLGQWFEGPDFWPDHMHPDDRDWAVPFCVDATARGKDHQFEYRMIAADGHVVWLNDIVTLHVVNQSVVLRGLMVDITDRKLAEEKLRQSESQLAEAQHLASVGSWSWDILNNTHTWSDELYRVFGLQPQESAPSFETYVELVHPDERDAFCRAVQHALKTQEPINTYRRIIRPDGAERILHSQWNTISDTSGTPIRMHGTLQDVTERRHAEDALREAEGKYRDIFENAGEGIFQSTPDGRFIAANPALAQMHGFASPEELIHSRQDISGQIYVDPARREEFKRQLEEQGAVRGFEHQVFKKDGSRIWISVNARVVRDEQGTIQYYEGTTQDITARRQAEQALPESEERYRELFENTKDATYVHDLNGKYLSLNRAAEKLSGYTRAEILGKSFIDFVPPEQIEHIRAHLYRKLVEEGETSYESEVITKDGRRVAVEINSHLIFENGVAVAVQGTARDITERKAAEEKLKATSEQLRALSARLQSAREEEGTRIAREIHDELGSVLTSLKWDLEATDRVLAGPMEPSQPAALREKLQALMKLTDLAISAIRRIASELRPSILDDLGLVAAIEWQAQQFQARTGIVCYCDCSLERVELSEEQSTAIFRILQEALTNVLRHAQATRVDIEINKENSYFTLSISDDGKGITESEKSEQQSLGILGMRERAHLIGGEVDIMGVEGKGTVVIVRVPVSVQAKVLTMTH